jgi:transglutaminase-like putative cysteine protease
MMFRPRDSHDLRLVEATMAITPTPRSVRWIYDVFGNSVAIAEFGGVAATELVFESRLVVETFEIENPNFPIEAYASTYPFAYAAEDVPDLARTIERHWPDPERTVDLWAKRFVGGNGPTDTAQMLATMATTIQAELFYQARDLPGVQAPDETLRMGSGSCRDYAVLMMEAARSLGFAARFVTGYVYSRDADGAGNVGGGATHAWVQIYLPGAGWVEFDPTNALVGGRNLIRVAVARDASQAAPLVGSFTGLPDDPLGMDVEVQVTTE